MDTRLGRIRDGDLDAVVLAAAGLSRLGRLTEVTELFGLTDWPTAPGQGAVAVETTAEASGRLAGVLAGLDHAPSRLTAFAERAVLGRLEAGCSAPVGASAIIDGELLLLSATVYRLVDDRDRRRRRRRIVRAHGRGRHGQGQPDGEGRQPCDRAAGEPPHPPSARTDTHLLLPRSVHISMLDNRAQTNIDEPQ